MGSVKMDSTRVAFLETLTELMEADPKVVVVFADSVKVFRATAVFVERFAGRVFDVGIAEQNAVAAAAGLAARTLLTTILFILRLISTNYLY